MRSSPVEEAFAALRSLNDSWNVEIGTPQGPGWIQGAELHDAARGPFNDPLVRIGERASRSSRASSAAPTMSQRCGRACTRLQLNLEWMKTQIERRAREGGHA